MLYKKGVLDSMKGTEIGKAVFYIPISHLDDFKSFLEQWNVNFYMMKILKE